MSHVPSSVEDDRYAAVLDWLAAHQVGDVLLLCAEAAPHAPAGTHGVRLSTCLAGTPAYRVVDLARAVRGRVVLALDGCGDPQRVVEAVGWLVEALPGRVQLREEAGSDRKGPVVEVVRPPVDRRHLVRLGNRPPSPFRHRIGTDDEARLLESLRALGVTGIDGRPAARNLTAFGCVACGVCVRACPHDALVLAADQGTSVLSLDVERCRGDLECVMACPQQALGNAGPQTWSAVLAGEVVEVARVSTQACPDCGATMPASATGTACTVCERRRDNPFGWHVPERIRSRLPEQWR